MFSASARASRPASRAVHEESEIPARSFLRTARRSFVALGLSCATAGAALSFSQPALGDEPANAPNPPSVAQALFEEGRTLMEAGKPELACPKFEESNTVDRSAGTLLNLGKCLEALGRTASALARYEEAVIVGRAANKVRQVTAAQEFIAALEPKLSKLTVDVVSRAPGLVVERTSLRPSSPVVELSSADLRVPLAVDPGEYRIDVKAAGYRSWSTLVTVGQGGDAKTVSVPELVLASTPKGPPIEKPRDKATTRFSPLRIASLATGGVGLVLAGIGATFGGLTLADASTAASDPTLCPNKKCTQKGEEFVEGARTKGVVSTVGLSIGGAALAAGAVMFVLSLGEEKHADPTKAKATSGLRIMPLVVPGATFDAPPAIGVTLGCNL